MLWERMYGAMRLRGHNTGFTMKALAGVDIALWDLRGQITGQPSNGWGGSRFGDHSHLLVDAHGAYDLGMSIHVGRYLEQLGCYWLEDPLMPENYLGYAELTRTLDIQVVAGETKCNRFQFRDRLVARDVILSDICWARGITEGQKIAVLADAF